MSVEEVAQEREISGFIVRVIKKGQIRVSAIKTIDKDITEFLDKIEMMEE